MALEELTERIELRTTPSTFAIIQKHAKTAGLTVSEYMRQMGEKQKIEINERDAQTDELVYQLVRIGTNLNQLAKVANTNGKMIEHEILPVLDKVNETIRRVFIDREDT